jgi:hypothetical protein
MADEEYQMLMQPKPVTLVDHPDYEAPRLKTTWMQMLPRMMCGCVILVVIVGAMVSVVWSVVSDAPGDPLHRQGGRKGVAASAAAIKQAALHASAKHSKDAKSKKDQSPWAFVEHLLNRSVNVSDVWFGRTKRGRGALFFATAFTGSHVHWQGRVIVYKKQGAPLPHYGGEGSNIFQFCIVAMHTDLWVRVLANLLPASRPKSNER